MGEWIKRRVDVLHPTATSSNSEHLTGAATLDSHAAINIASLATTPVNLNQTELGWVEINLPTANATSDQGNQPWAALRSTLKALKLTLKAFPPLEAIATQLLDCFDDMKSTEKYRKEYLDLAKSLERTLRRLNEHIPLANPGGMSDEVNRIVSEIQGQIDNIKKQKNHGTLRRMVQVRKDTDELMRCHRQIEVLFAQLQVDLSIGTHSIVDETLVDSRLRGIGPAYEATYNSIQSMDVKRRAWTGKTTIAYTTCTQLEENNQLGANFFCSRTLPGCRDVGRVIPTIAYQLARFFPPFRSQLCQILADDPDASTRDLTTQFRKLLKEPMKLIKDIIPNNIVVLIDALDELDGPSSARLFLKLLFENAGGMPVRFFVTSRPDHGLYDAIMSQGSHMRNVFHLHEIENSFVQADIGTYLNAELGPLSLPSSQIQQLAEQAGRFFIYAATAVEYLEPSDPEADHGTRLTTLLRLTSEQPNPRQQKIDGLYAAILRAVFEKPNRDPSEIECIKLVLWSAICAQEPLTAASLSKLLKLDNDRQVVIALKPLRSVLHISEHTEHISTLHASFPDFMFNHKRSGDYACNELTHHGLLAERCFELMQNQLRFNICKLESTLSFDRDVPNLSAATDTIISSELFYACQYWGAHLQHSSITDSLVSHVKNLMMYRLLTWMEVLTLKQAISRGESILGGVERWLQDNNTGPHAHQFVHDAWRFVTSFAASPASASTPHIYISALALWHPESLIFKQYSFLIQGCMRIDETSFTYGSPALLATWDNGTGSQMNSIALSPDGSRLVSGDSGFHNTSSMYVWDVRVGSIILRKPIPRSAGVLSVAFSGDGTRIASGCSDRSIYIWDAITGEAVSSLFQLDSKAVCVAFSHDGSRVICGFDDGTIHNLDTMTGRAIVEPFRNHTRTVNSIAVSPDGTHLVSGSDDHTVYVCELHTGSNRGPFVGHTGAVLSVAYSPCGTRVASGSADRMIRIWNVLTGDAQVTFGPWTIGRRTGTVCSVAFSPNGSRIVSGLGDYAIYVWDSVTGQMVAGPFQGSSAPVNAVVVAPDSTRIFSCSSDGTIGVWDLRSPTTTSVIKRKGHSAPIRGLVASRTGGLIFSLTKIGEVGTWDVLDGSVVELTTSLRGELNSEINTLTFIPSSLNNNRQIVATHIGSNISVWNLSTGKTRSWTVPGAHWPGPLGSYLPEWQGRYHWFRR
ncbi:vegetative incompatibility protein HET-E-1, putative [Rhizoctonia solani AG-3 Rhs1AP]|uniref:Vegetative incompatibility protein HET-E-1, putative n=1 Tax=Rhizoctonia solani AG-3 Rhs1AP TaxID=1086054 RepID=X8JF69_9AGAM|nr:vegetative incompatibility protein HET-E-1, putative [Rhizoctonia solani AG-3 Rhs1AP]